MTIKQALEKGTIMLKGENLDSPKIKARLLMQDILNKPRTYLLVHDNQIINEKILELNSDINRNDEEFKTLYKEKTQLLEDNLTNIHNSIIENVTSSSDEIKNTMADDRTMIIDTLNQDVERVEKAVVNNSETINNNISEVNANISNTFHSNRK